VHDVFYVSQLKKCLRVPKEQIPMEDLDAKEDLSYLEHPVRILERSERVTRNKGIRDAHLRVDGRESFPVLWSMDRPSWTRSMKPWTYSMGSSIQK
jgi:hypothetical protein